MDQGILRRSNPNFENSSLRPTSFRTGPPLPPKPISGAPSTMANNYIPYSGSLGYSSYGSMPYRSSLYGSYGTGGYGGSFGSYGSSSYGFGMNGYPYGAQDDAERRFIQYAEESSRSTFANVENVVRAFSSIAMMLDNTFFAMTSSFRAVLSVAENMGRLRTMFGHIWYSVSIFRLFNWLYRKLMQLLGVAVPKSIRQEAWFEANQLAGTAPPSPGGSSWPTLAFFGILLSAPYFISKILPKYEDKASPENWKSPGTRAKVAFDFTATSPNEMTVYTNDEILIAPVYIQEEMKLVNSGWAFAVSNGKSGIVPLNYLVLMKKVNPNQNFLNKNNMIPRPPEVPRNNIKRVSFGETQIFTETDPPPHKLPSLVSKQADDKNEINSEEQPHEEASKLSLQQNIEKAPEVKPETI